MLYTGLLYWRLFQPRYTLTTLYRCPDQGDRIMTDKTKTPIEAQSANRTDQGRRRSVKNILAGSAAFAGAAMSSDQWKRPVVKTVMTPAHAATSDCCPGYFDPSSVACYSIGYASGQGYSTGSSDIGSGYYIINLLYSGPQPSETCPEYGLVITKTT